MGGNVGTAETHLKYLQVLSFRDLALRICALMLPCFGGELQDFKSPYNVLAAHFRTRLVAQAVIPVALSFPNLQAKKLKMVLVVLLVLSSDSFAAWGNTGAEPFTLMNFAFTGYPTFNSVIKYSDEGEVLEDKMVYSLGDPEILEDCMAPFTRKL